MLHILESAQQRSVEGQVFVPLRLNENQRTLRRGPRPDDLEPASLASGHSGRNQSDGDAPVSQLFRAAHQPQVHEGQAFPAGAQCALCAARTACWRRLWEGRKAGDLDSPPVTSQASQQSPYLGRPLTECTCSLGAAYSQESWHGWAWGMALRKVTSAV